MAAELRGLELQESIGGDNRHYHHVQPDLAHYWVPSIYQQCDHRRVAQELEGHTVTRQVTG